MQRQTIQQYYGNGAGALNKELLVFLQSPLLGKLVRKAERIKSAFVLLSQQVPREESQLLLELSRETFFAALDFLKSDANENALALKLRMGIIKLNSLVDDLYIKSDLSEPNANILKRALLDFSHVLEQVLAGDSKSAFAFEHDDFITVDESEILSAMDSAELASLRAVKEPHTFKSPASSIKDKTKNSKGHKGQITENGKQRKRPMSLKDKMSSRSRRLMILDLLQGKQDGLSLSELASGMPSWSPKTIQRELQSLCNEGVVQKFGEKRWTRYVLSS